MNAATDKQVSYAISLLAKAGFSTRFMNAEFALLGASTLPRDGRVEDWLAGMSKIEISNLINKLKEWK